VPFTLLPPREETLTHSTLPEANNSQPSIVILGMGNLLLKDEGVGVHLAKLISQKPNNVKLEIIDGGTFPDILSLPDNVTKLIIVDAAKGVGKPGTIYRFHADDINSRLKPTFSLHQIDILDSLKMLSLLGKQPKSTVIFGIEPKVIDWGLELSPEIEAKLPEIMKLVLKEISET